MRIFYRRSGLWEEVIERIKNAQIRDEKLATIVEKMKQGKNSPFVIEKIGAYPLTIDFYVPDVNGLRHKIMEEAHTMPYAMHLGSTKMYQNLITHY